MEMERSTINKILTSRHLYSIAKENLRSENGVKLSVGVNLLQDSIELFLIAISEFLDAPIKISTKFHEYFDIINKKIAPKELPFKSRLLSLNKLRVNSKHYGLQPALDESKDSLIVANEFLEEVSKIVFSKKFASFSLIDLLNDGETKDLLNEAENYFSNERYSDALISCRKAIYVEIEKDYDISHYKDKGSSQKYLGLIFYGHKAPYWTKNKEYIEEKVTEPTDYIVLDHSTLDMDLMKYGVSTNTFWNIWRLTPNVFRSDKDSRWVVKHQFKCFEDEGIKDRAEYVLISSIELMLSIHQAKNRTKSPDYRLYYLNLNQTKVPVYSKATTNSKIVRHTPDGLTQLDTDFNVTGLDSDDTFWHVSYSNLEDKIYFSGFIHEDYLKQDKG